MITPREARHLEDGGSFDGAIEDRIDAALRDSALRGQWPVRIAIATGWPRIALDRVLKRYRRVGWYTGIVADGRDGDFVELDYPGPLRVAPIGDGVFALCRDRRR